MQCKETQKQIMGRERKEREIRVASRFLLFFNPALESGKEKEV